MKNKNPLRNAISLILRFLGVIFGVLAIVSGEFDDSPGLQGIGVVLILSVFFSIFKIVKRD